MGWVIPAGMADNNSFHLVLYDNYEQQVLIPVDVNLLQKSFPFFKNFVEKINHDTAAAKLWVPDSHVAADIIRSLEYDIATVEQYSQVFGTYPKWLYNLRIFRCRTRFGLANDLDNLYENEKIPFEPSKEKFDELICVLVECFATFFGKDKGINHILRRNLPLDYPMDNFPKELSELLLPFSDYYFAWAGLSSDINIWMPIPSEQEKKITTKFKVINSITFSNNGNYMAIVGDNRAFQIMEITKSHGWVTRGTHTELLYEIVSPVFSPCDQYIAFSSDNLVKVLCLNDMTITRLVSHSDTVKSISFSPNGRIASCGIDTTVRIWEKNQFRKNEFMLSQILYDSGRLHNILFLDEDNIIVSNSGYVKVWKLSITKQIKEIACHGIINGISLLPNDAGIAVTVNHIIYLWNRNFDRMYQKIETTNTIFCRLAFSPWEMASVTYNGFKIWTLMPDGQYELVFQSQPTKMIHTTVAFSNRICNEIDKKLINHLVGLTY